MTNEYMVKIVKGEKWVFVNRLGIGMIILSNDMNQYIFHPMDYIEYTAELCELLSKTLKTLNSALIEK